MYWILFAAGVSPLRRRGGGFPIAPSTPSGACPPMLQCCIVAWKVRTVHKLNQFRYKSSNMGVQGEGVQRATAKPSGCRKQDQFQRKGLRSHPEGCFTPSGGEVMSEFRGVTPPNSVEAEQSVLGAMMQDENAVLQAAEALVHRRFLSAGAPRNLRGDGCPAPVSSAQSTS